MKIYDYYDENSLTTIVFVIVTVVCLFVFVFLITKCLSMIRRRQLGTESVLLVLSTVVVLVLMIFISAQSFSLIRFDLNCKNQKYESVTGILEVIEVEQNDYRDAEQYDIIFSVDNVLFDDGVAGFSKEQKDKLIEYDSKKITAYYSYIGNDIVIYQILA